MSNQDNPNQIYNRRTKSNWEQENRREIKLRKRKVRKNIFFIFFWTLISLFTLIAFPIMLYGWEITTDIQTLALAEIILLLMCFSLVKAELNAYSRNKKALISFSSSLSIHDDIKESLKMRRDY